jgi:hypothetical protein
MDYYGGMTVNNDTNNDPSDSVNRQGHALAYNASIAETVQTMDAILRLHPDMLKSIVDVCNSWHNGTAPDPDTARMLDDLVGPDIADAALSMIAENCGGDTDADDIVPNIMHPWPLEVMVTHPIQEPANVRSVTLVVTVGGPRCEVTVPAVEAVTVTTWWGVEQATAQVDAPLFSDWWFELAQGWGGAS